MTGPTHLASFEAVFGAGCDVHSVDSAVQTWLSASNADRVWALRRQLTFARHGRLPAAGRGLGAIGLRFAKVADALGMRVLGFDPYAKNLPTYVQPVELKTIWQESDAISLHCPLTADNAKLLNERSPRANAA